MRTLTNLVLGTLAGVLTGLLIFILLRPRRDEADRLPYPSWKKEGKPGVSSPGREDNLEVIYGIGPAYARRLNEAGIRTYAGLAGTSPFRLAEIVGPRASLSDIAAWIGQARELSKQAIKE
jgi:predicted flap endonuclease-1-like 5' DNA nuclease